MKVLLMSALLALLFLPAYAQDVYGPPTKSVYVELGGAGLPYSVNYDFRFDKHRVDSWGMRIGAGGWAINEGENSRTSMLTIPLQINRLLGRDKHYFEIGGGATFVRYRDTYTSYWGTPTITTSENWNFILDTGNTPALMGTLNLGYRRVPVDGGFTFKANLNPIFNHNGFWPLWFGIGFGYAFN
ncbi:hypothetical protein KIH41_05810 [Litoribacter ruber]|uniref:Outer membrane beta-barrel protein n=1 Tax=Litoribacter ruber TaxID=702568 RepID=A0AAP2G428_9BACT|nr:MULTISPECIES: hypothetical protein [Litoribacter]MBS9523043.1 hypothetical protein [Litoribacter alkaliphilus]MBT0810793.1 hypothetical protein [Litoribacter ruber]